MKVWLYYRLSRDEDEELNSLNNQRKIIYNFAVSSGHEVVGESFDDNVSGMHFNREGIDKIYEVVEAGKIEAIIVKDLSRLGRHRTQTALFIDYLREHDVRVLSATENIDTFNENDDLIIGFKGLVKNISHSGKVSNDFSLFRRFCCINRCFRCSCGKFAIVHGEQAAIGFRAAAIGEKRDPPETHPVQPRTESIRPCRSTRAKPASKELDRALFV